MTVVENQKAATHMSVQRTSLEYVLSEARCARRLQDRDSWETYKAIRNAIDELAQILGYNADELDDDDADDDDDDDDED